MDERLALKIPFCWYKVGLKYFFAWAMGQKTSIITPESAYWQMLVEDQTHPTKGFSYF